MSWFSANWAEKVSDLVLLNPKTYLRIVKRQYPVGFISYAGIVCLVWLATLDGLVLVSIPVLVLYALIYSLFIHMGVKSELRKPGSYILTVDNTLLAFTMSMVALLILSYPLLLIYNIFGGASHIAPVVISTLGLMFFNCSMRLTLLTYPEAEPDHLFGASLVPFVVVCLVIYFL